MIQKIYDLSPHVDPDLVEALKELPEWELDEDTLPYIRQFNAAEPIVAPPGFSIENLQVPAIGEDSIGGGPNGEGYEVPVRVYRPDELDPEAPALVWIHGGGFVMGGMSYNDRLCLGMAHHGQCAVVSIDYRLAPEHPFPAAFDDCYAVLEWLARKPEKARLQPDKIAIAGVSAGACLAAGVTLKARDQNGPCLVHQFLIIPDLDDRLQTASSHRIHDPRIWDRSTAEASWRMYLGASHDAEVSAYAAPARATDLSGLPSATVLVEDLDVLRDEGVDYANRLHDAGVKTELHVYPGTFHGHFGIAPDAAISQRTVNDILSSVQRVFAEVGS